MIAVADAAAPVLRQTLRAVLAGVLALPITLVLLFLVERNAGVPELRLEGFVFQLLVGQGGMTPSGLELRAPDASGRALAALPLSNLRAERYRALRFDVTGLDLAAGSSLYWVRADQPTVGLSRPLTLEEARRGDVQLDQDPRWRGEILSVGFIVQSPFDSPVLIRSIGFVPNETSFGDVTRRLLDNWTYLSDWDGGSVNFYVGARREERRLTPVVMVSIWLVTALLLGWVLGAKSMSVVMLLVAWGLLDVRWQADLWARHLQPTNDSALEADARRAATLQEWRNSWMTDATSRVFIVSDDPSGYAAYRSRYHLGAVRTSFGMTRLPNLAERRAGDFVLVLGSREPLQLNRRAGLLMSPTETVPIDLLAGTAEAGTLFRVRGGN